MQASELSDRPDPRVIAALCEALNNDADMTVRRAAAMALTDRLQPFVTDALLDTLLDALDDEHPDVRKAPAQALSGRDDPQITAKLITTLGDSDPATAMSDDPPAPVPVLGEAPVLADPAGRGAERALARFGLIPYAPPVFTPCARAPLARLLLGLPALASTGLLDTAHAVYGELPNGFYSLDAMLCAGVFRALQGAARAEGAARIDPPALGRVLGLDRRRRPRRSAARSGCSPTRAPRANGSPRWPAGTPRPAPSRPRCAMSMGMCGPIRAPAGSRKPMCRG